jgi:hypothetical protein
MKEKWLFPGAVVPVDVETTAALVAEIHRLIDVVGGMALARPCPTCEALARTVMLDQTSHDTQRQWVGLTDEERAQLEETTTCLANESWLRNLTRAIEAKLKEKNT